MNNLNTLFLEQSYNDCREYTRESILSDRYDAWDFIVLTASNDEQAKNYNLQIKERLQTKILNNNIKYLVVPDCNGERIGSGGATLNVLLILKEQYGVDFTKNKVLIIHSGGDSKRIPQYSVCGKLFSPVQSLLNNRFGSTLFDELIALSAIIPSRMANGIMIMSGDAMLLFNPLQVDFKSGGVAAISTKLSAEIAKNHGVFLVNEKGELLEFLHKKSVAELCAKGATNAQGNVDVDTGIILFDGAIADKMLSLVMTDGLVDNSKAKAYINATVRLSFYGDFLYPLAKNATLSDYLQQAGEGEPCEEIIECRKAIFKILNKYKMQIKSVSPAQFLHFGTTRELFDLVTENVADYAYLGWKKYILSTYEPQCCSVYHASISSSKVGKKNYFENSIVENSNIGSGSIFSFVEIKNKTIPDDIVLSGLKMNDGHFVVRIYGLKDDPKQSLEKDSWLGVSLSKKLQQYDEKHDPSIGKGSLWMADIFPVADTMESAVDMAINTYELFILGDQTKYAQWRDSEKVSFSSSFRNADVEWLILWQKNIDRTILIDKAYDCIKNKKTFGEFALIFENFNFVEYFKELLAKCGENISDKMRLYFFASQLSDRKNEKIFFEDNAFEQIKALCACKNEKVFRGKIKNNSVKVALPARVNFGGGWTDTPPYCVENGGAVLNASIQIAGELPIRAYVKKLDKREIVLRSIDSNESKAFATKAEILDCADPFDTFALQKACLVATNVITESDDKDLANAFDIFGGGFELTTEVVNIPKGSGLGTSSILSAACVKAIYEFFGAKYTTQNISDTVLRMEQLMSTGGGWQDQIGGLVNGVKFCSTRSGIQELIIDKVEINQQTKDELSQRFMLIYTGQRRLARNLLRDIVGEYLLGNQRVVNSLRDIEQISCVMKHELEKGNVDKFAFLLSEHWEKVKLMDKGSSNTCIDYIFAACDDLLAGKMVCGAGGGGFLQVVVKEGVTKEMLNDRLIDLFGDAGVKVWDSQLVW